MYIFNRKYAQNCNTILYAAWGLSVMNRGHQRYPFIPGVDISDITYNAATARRCTVMTAARA